ncbi:hypothetical protein CEK62_04385 [Alcanivorax sp. N3-2A]|nr:hypothetical protein CEK62_04385 [Alcanivorax sp. N3-2A]
MADNSAYQHRDLVYFQERQCSSQWRLFLQMLLKELSDKAGSDESLDFLRQVGTRMAESLPMREQDTLQGLEAAINQHWRAMDWGWCALLAEADRIRIVHGAWPRVSHGPAWPLAIASTLEGAYDFWLKRQGGGAVSVRTLRAEEGGALEFCYGC